MTEPTAPELALMDGDAAIIFRANGEFEVVIPRAMGPGEAIGESTMCALILREVVQDADTMRRFAHKLVDSGVMALK